MDQMSSTSVMLAVLAILGLATAVFLIHTFRKADRKATEARRPQNVKTAIDYAWMTPVTDKYAATYGVSHREAEDVEVEFKRWFVLVTLYGPLGMPDCPVDDYWHLAICDTKLYRNLCADVAGRFIDHDPNDGSPTGATRTFALYREVFGSKPHPRYWSRNAGVAEAPAQTAARAKLTKPVLKPLKGAKTVTRDYASHATAPAAQPHDPNFPMNALLLNAVLSDDKPAALPEQKDVQQDHSSSDRPSSNHSSHDSHASPASESSNSHSSHGSASSCSSSSSSGSSCGGGSSCGSN